MKLLINGNELDIINAKCVEGFVGKDKYKKNFVVPQHDHDYMVQVVYKVRQEWIDGDQEDMSHSCDWDNPDHIDIAVY